MTQPIVAPYVPSYAVFNPYITAEEFLQSATGVDSSNLVRGASREANAAALANLIGRASNYADGLCHQVLCATADVQSGRYRVQGSGVIRVAFDCSPLVEVTSASFGARPGQLQALTDLSGVWIDRKVADIPLTGYGCGSGDVFAQVGYVAGYANTTLKTATAAGGTILTVASPLGIFPGLAMELYDSEKSEAVTVASTYVQGATAVPLTSALAFAHDPGTAVSAMPPAIKFAVVKLTTWMIKTRGAAALTLDSISGGRPKAQKMDAGGGEDYDDALDALTPFRRIV